MNTLGLYSFVSTNARLLASGIVPDWLVSMCAVHRQTNLGLHNTLCDLRNNQDVGMKRAGQHLLHHRSIPFVTPHDTQTGFVDVADPHLASKGSPPYLWFEHCPLQLDGPERTAKASRGNLDGNEELLHEPSGVTIGVDAEEAGHTTSVTTSSPVLTDGPNPAARSSTPLSCDVVETTAPPSVLDNDPFAQSAVESGVSGRSLAISSSPPSGENAYDRADKNSQRPLDDDIAVRVAAHTPLPSPTCLDTILLNATDLPSGAETASALSSSALRRLRRRDAETRAAAEGRRPVQNDQSIRRMKKRQKMTTCQVPADQTVPPQDQRVTRGNDDSQSPSNSLTSPKSSQQCTTRNLHQLSDAEAFPSKDARGIIKRAAVVKLSIRPPYDGISDGYAVPKGHGRALAVNARSRPVHTNGKQQFVDESLSFVPQAVSVRNGKSVAISSGNRSSDDNGISSTLHGPGGIQDSVAEVAAGNYLPVRDPENQEKLNPDNERYRRQVIPIDEHYSQPQAAMEGSPLLDPVAVVDRGVATNTVMGRGNQHNFLTGYLLLPHAGFEVWPAYMDENTAEDDGTTTHRPTNKPGMKHNAPTHKAPADDATLCTSEILSTSYERNDQLQRFSLPALDRPWSPSFADSEECLERPTIPGASRCPLHDHGRPPYNQRKQTGKRLFVTTTRSGVHSSSPFVLSQTAPTT